MHITSILQRSFIAWMGAAIVSGVIFLISPAHASGDKAMCTPEDEALSAIKPLGAPEALPALTLTTPDGREVTLADYLGRGVVLNFWATWCAPCVREMPELDRLNAALAPVGIDVLAASMDRGGHSVIAAFYEKIGITNLAALHDPKGVAARALGIRGLPTTLIIAPDGREVARIEGIHHYDTDSTKAYLKRCIGPE